MVNEGGNATLKDSQLLTNFLSDRVELIVISSRPFRLAAHIYIYIYMSRDIKLPSVSFSLHYPYSELNTCAFMYSKGPV